ISASAAMLRQWCNSRAIDGVIWVLGNRRDERFVAEMSGPDCPGVIVRDFTAEPIAYAAAVTVRLDAGATHVARMLVETGHRTIGFIDSKPHDVVYLSFREELQRRGVELADAYVRIAGTTPEDGARAMDELLKQPRRPTALFT